MTHKRNTSAGGTNAAAVTTANSGGTSGDPWSINGTNSPVYDTSTGATGFGDTTSIKCSVASTTKWVTWNGLNAAAIVIKSKFKVDALGAIRIYDYRDSGGVAHARLAINASNKLVLNGTVGTLWTSAAAIVANQWYRFEVGIQIGASDIVQAAYYLDNSSTAVETFGPSTVAGNSSNVTELRFGPSAANTVTLNMWIDSCEYDDSQGTTYIGPDTVTNTAPNANAGPDQSAVEPYSTVTLNGTGSSDSDVGDTITYAWTQTAGTTVSLSSSTAASPTFTAPATVSGSTLTFSLVVTDNHGAASTADTVSIAVVPHTVFRIDAGGPTPIRVQKL